MKASRELDALIAEKVMGLLPYALLPPGKRFVRKDIPHYSTQIADAWLVVEKLGEGDDRMHLEMKTYIGSVGARFVKSPPHEWMLKEFYHPADHDDMADTAPLAICLAALKAVEVT